MKVLWYYPSIPRYLLARGLGKHYPVSALPLRLKELAEPEPPPGWIRVRVRLCGICGSDLALLWGKSSPRLSPFFSFPAVLGHEILGEVDGTRVVVNPLLACRQRGLEPCVACQQGVEGLCQQSAEGAIAPGILGYCRDLPGGWGEWLVVHAERLYEVPSTMPDKRAVLTEPLAVVLRGLRLWKLDTEPKVLVIGAGPIGLLAVKALRLWGYQGQIHLAARYPLQAELGKVLGADQIHPSAWEAAEAVGAKAYRALIGPPGWRGGFEAVINAAGSAASLEQAAWSTREGGKLLLLGAPGILWHDLSPYWFRELTLIGSYTYTHADFQEALALLSEAEGLEQMVTHTFPLSAWREALQALRLHRGVKVVFQPQGS